jgi:hypothetical protein
VFRKVVMSGSHKSEIGDEQSASWLAKLGGSVMSRRRGTASAGDEPRGLEPALAVPLGTEIVDRPSGRITVEEPESEEDEQRELAAGREVGGGDLEPGLTLTWPQGEITDRDRSPTPRQGKRMLMDGGETFSSPKSPRSESSQTKAVASVFAMKDGRTIPCVDLASQSDEGDTRSLTATTGQGGELPGAESPGTTHNVPRQLGLNSRVKQRVYRRYDPRNLEPRTVVGQTPQQLWAEFLRVYPQGADGTAGGEYFPIDCTSGRR